MIDVNGDMENIIGRERVALIDFWSPWCGPCKMIKPMLEELEKEFIGKAMFLKCNVDDNTKYSVKYNIRSIPTIIIMKCAEIDDVIIGAVPKHVIKKALEKALEG